MGFNGVERGWMGFKTMNLNGVKMICIYIYIWWFLRMFIHEERPLRFNVLSCPVLLCHPCTQAACPSSDTVHVAGLVVRSKATCFLKLCRDSDCRWVGCGMQTGGECGLRPSKVMRETVESFMKTRDVVQRVEVWRWVVLILAVFCFLFLVSLYNADFCSEVNDAACRIPWFANEPFLTTCRSSRTLNPLACANLHSHPK